MTIPKAHSFELRMCGDPHCGAPHIIAFDSRERPICDIAIPVRGAPSLIKAMQDILYAGAVERDHD